MIENYIQAQTDGTSCDFATGSFLWWAINPLTKNTASTVSTYFEGVVYPDQSICFRAFSWTRHGVVFDAYWLPDWCEVASSAAENYTTGALTIDVPAYGNMQVLAGWEVLANTVTPDGTRVDGISWNYN